MAPNMRAHLAILAASPTRAVLALALVGVRSFAPSSSRWKVTRPQASDSWDEAADVDQASDSWDEAEPTSTFSADVDLFGDYSVSLVDAAEEDEPSAVDLFAYASDEGVLDAEEGVFCDAGDDANAEECVDAGAFWALEDEPDYGEVDSHVVVERDANGAPLRSAFTFVDERACVGCHLCASISPSTFFMEEEHGMARVFRQHGDADEIIEEAAAACPVGCIKQVTYDALERLEVARRGNVINAAGRLSSRAEGRAPRTFIPAADLVDTTDPAFVAEERRRESARRREATAAAGLPGSRVVEL